MVAQSHPDDAVSRIAAAIGEPARSRILYCLVDGRAKTSTELAVVAEVSPSTASSHLQRLLAERLVKMTAQGKHRYYSLVGPDVAAALEALSVLAAQPRHQFVPRTPHRLQAARKCYDHIAGTLGVLLHDRFVTLGYLRHGSRDNECDLTSNGERAIAALGIDVAATRMTRRRFAYTCVDWSERRPHLGGALAAAFLKLALARKWVLQDPDGRALHVTISGRRELAIRFGLQV
jgi:DNA-binding transcriptional ArsR family regulator